MRNLARSRLVIGVAVCWAGFLAALVANVAALHLAFGVAVVLLIPGLLTLELAGLRPGPLERWAAAVGLSIGWLIFTVIIASLTKGGITQGSTTVTLGATTAVLFGVALAAAYRRLDRHSEEQTVVIPPLGARLQAPTRNRRVVLGWCLAGAVIAGCATCGIWLSVTTAQTAASEQFTQLSIARVGDSEAFRLNVTNLEGRAVSYQLQLAVPGADASEQTIILSAGQSYTRDIEAVKSGDLVATLRGGSATPLGYRQVRAVVP